MNIALIALIFLPLVYSKEAFIALLSSNDFMLPAKVLAQSLKLHNVSVPLVLYCTEDITDHTIQRLHKAEIQTIRVKKLNNLNPTVYSATKLQYTKMRAWSFTNYTTLVHIDLDIIVTADISELFRCGSFCAVMRHSDMFNSGVYVLKPNMTVYYDMLAKRNIPAYDHGDQGFLNSYYSRLKYAPMFDPDDVNWPKNSDGIYRLSSVYNYDVGMYYLQSRMLVNPKVIHYTLGSTKPWFWWTYPMFDLNWKWLEVRNLIDDEFPDASSNILFCLLETVIIVSLFAIVTFLKKVEISLHKFYSVFLSRLSIVLSQFISVFVALTLVPNGRSPGLSWSIFLGNQLVILLFLNAVRVQLLEECCVSAVRVSQYFIVSSLSALLIYNTLSYTALFSTRLKLMLLLVPAWFVVVFLLCARLRNGKACKAVRYKLVDDDVTEHNF